MRRLVVGILAAVLAAGCVRDLPSDKPPIHLNPNMLKQPRYNPQAHSDFFDDSATMRMPVAGTVEMGFLRTDQIYYTGMINDTTPVDKSPVLATMQLLRRGQERFNIFCSPCHSRLGDGNGIIVSRGYVPPPSFHSDLSLKFQDGHIFDVITNGLRNMPAYRYQIPVADRWAIVAYFRALQRSQNGTSKDIPPELWNQVK
jgi:mono/diheme cytochrome c family protein